MALEHRKNCTDCGVERLVVISATEAEVVALAIVGLAMWAGMIYVAGHFILKYW